MLLCMVVEWLCRPQEACADLEHVVELDPSVTVAYINLGIIAMQQLNNYRRCVLCVSILLCCLNKTHIRCIIAWIVHNVTCFFS